MSIIKVTMSKVVTLSTYIICCFFTCPLWLVLCLELSVSCIDWSILRLASERSAHPMTSVLDKKFTDSRKITDYYSLGRELGQYAKLLQQTFCLFFYGAKNRKK